MVEGVWVQPVGRNYKRETGGVQKKLEVKMFFFYSVLMDNRKKSWSRDQECTPKRDHLGSGVRQGRAVKEYMLQIADLVEAPWQSAKTFRVVISTVF